jgi:hypothetical protein
MTKLRDAAQLVADSLRSGNLEEAETYMSMLQLLIPTSECPMDRIAAVGLILEARKLVTVHRAQTIQALQSLVRYKLYAPENATPPPAFQMQA